MDEDDRTIQFMPLPASKEMAEVLALMELTRAQIHDAFIMPRKLSNAEIIAAAYEKLAQPNMRQAADSAEFPHLIEGELTLPPHKETETP